ncbi:MAG TPA: hypothetical protein VEV15_06555 [Flavisolibacter sp.]|nr:hypothetical protein [Flavisolibacter sp.]
MKRVLFLMIVLFGITTIASAQTTKNNNSSTKKTVRDTLATTKKTTTTSVKVSADSATLINNRDIYNWSDGQRSTLTGEEATSSNGSGYAALKKDTAKVIGNRKQQ